MSAVRSTPAPSRRLPDRPSLEHLRKQAKDLLKGYLSGDAAAVVEVERFEHKAGPSFSLVDAQRVLARTYGYPSWPKLKAFIDGVDMTRFAAAVQDGDLPRVRSMLASRPELVSLEMAGNNEHRAIHYAVLRRDAAMVRLLMESGADARKGIYPHRDATSAWTIARDREYGDILAVVENEERARREEMSCSNATVSPIQDQISAAIGQGDRINAIRLLEGNLSLLHACDRDGRTPLHVAASRNDVDLVAWMLAKRANVRKKDPRGLTPLDHAALAADPRNRGAEQFPAIAKMLVQQGAEMTIRAAVALGDEARTREFLSADPGLLRQIEVNGGLVTLAVNHRQINVVRLLLDMGADVDERILLQELEEAAESWGMPLWHAALAGDLAITRLLLDRGADPNANVYASGWPLRNAWNHADDSVKNLLLERGALPQPYMVSEAHNIEEARRLLAENPSEELANELAWSAADHGCPEIVELCLPILAWPRNDPRWHWILIQPIRGAEGVPSKMEGYFECMAALLRHGVDPNVARFGQAPLHFAAGNRGNLSGTDRARFASMLVDHGADLSLRDDLLRSTPLGWACRWGHVDLVNMLMSRGAPVHEADAEPWATPIAWAQKMNHPEILALLKNAARDGKE